VLGVYEAVLSEHSPAWSNRISTERLGSKLDRQAEQTAAVQADVTDLVTMWRAGVENDPSRTRSRLPRLPDGLHDLVDAASGSDPGRTWRLVDTLTAPASDPEQTVAAWENDLPSYLQDAPGPVLLLAAEAALAWGGTHGNRLLLAAAHAGAPDFQVLVARAALAEPPGKEDEGLRVLAAAGAAEHSVRPFVRAADALLHEDWDRARLALDTWVPTDAKDRRRKWWAAHRLLFCSTASPRITPSLLSESVTDARDTLAARAARSSRCCSRNT
jgi:hypothetical protein